ncbi:MAG: hypothetical protein M3401_12910 [Actinomycetota bacterium]|nr:hypothetical protein [Actinomycetota bacterium]
MVARKWAAAALAVVWLASAATAASADGKAKGRCVSELARAKLISDEVNPGKANFIVGTQEDDAFSPEQFTPGVDVVCGFDGNDRVEGLSEGDVFLGGAGDDVVTGDDRTTVRLEGGTFVGGAGDDRVDSLQRGTFDGGAGSDFVMFMRGGTFDGGPGNDTVGFLYGETFNGGAGGDHVSFLRGGTFNGGPGTDTVFQRGLGGTAGVFNQY